MNTRERLAKRGDDLGYLKVARRMRTAVQIAEAMEKRHISKKDLAQMMGRRPSEITKWLSGDHNFTQDILAEISYYLKTDISGVSQVVTVNYSSVSYSSTVIIQYPEHVIKSTPSSRVRWRMAYGVKSRNNS